MATEPNYMLVETELDVPDEFQEAQTRALFGEDTAQSFVRRPMRGIRLKKETFASLSVQGPGASPSLANSSSPETFSPSFTSNFILQSVSETRSEKFQPLTTFGAPYGFFFGEQPRMMTFTALLLNTADFQWEIEWWDNYENVFRGTRLADRGLRVYLTYDDTIIEGYIIQAGTTKNAQRPYEANLSFTMWVTDVIYLVTPGYSKISSRHADNRGSLSLEFDDIESQGVIGDDSATAAVRAANIAAVTSQGTGLLSALRNGLETVTDFVDSVGNAIDSAIDFLYGRNMVIPAGFAGSEATSGAAIFASGSGFEQLSGQDLGGVLDGSSLNFRVPGTITGVAKAPTAFYDNIDEYPARTTEGRLTEAEVQAAVAGAFTGLDTQEKYDAAFYTEAAEATFAEFGFNITNEEGQQTSEVLRAAGRAAFAALSYAAMTTGASQAAASLTVGNVVGTVAANEEQSAGESG